MAPGREGERNMDPESLYDAGRRTPTPRRRVSSPQSPTTPVDLEVLLSLDFVCRRKSRSVLNCTVVGRDGYTPYFHIVTSDDEGLMRTLLRTNEGRTVGAVDWGGKDGATYVEIPKAVKKQRVSEWLSMSGDARQVNYVHYRMMHAYGKIYIWAPQRDSICMYPWDPSAVGDVPNILARIEKEDRTVTLDISLEAVNSGLLEIAVVATMVFQSGCRID
ncbi:hypothetical protein DFH07DRAFT_922051 [Mycena maculata]|uniref:Uncharacterized protein n=1 Tax=Mycena maculata TaxID=230809 RepID=A0AAD7IVW3_9AGAR|nr:hypothetical protein DFH07DRAFT_922051 [Mycena maculata]